MVECIIPAAGTSSRMRSWKLFLPFRKKPVVEHVLSAALGAADQVIVVSGFRSKALEEYIENHTYPLHRITFLENDGYLQGMFSSIQTGLRESLSDTVFILHADLPLITADTLDRLKTYRDSLETPADIIQPVYDGTPGHPVLLNAKARELALSQPPTSSMREVMRLCSYEQVPWDDPSIITDVDTPETYQKLLRTH